MGLLESIKIKTSEEFQAILSRPWQAKGNWIWCGSFLLGKFDWLGLAEHIVQIHNEAIKPNPLEQ